MSLNDVEKQEATKCLHSIFDDMDTLVQQNGNGITDDGAGVNAVLEVGSKWFAAGVKLDEAKDYGGSIVAFKDAAIMFLILDNLKEGGLSQQLKNCQKHALKKAVLNKQLLAKMNQQGQQAPPQQQSEPQGEDLFGEPPSYGSAPPQQQQTPQDFFNEPPQQQYQPPPQTNEEPTNHFNSGFQPHINQTPPPYQPQNVAPQQNIPQNPYENQYNAPPQNDMYLSGDQNNNAQPLSPGLPPAPGILGHQVQTQNAFNNQNQGKPQVGGFVPYQGPSSSSLGSQPSILDANAGPRIDTTAVQADLKNAIAALQFDKYDSARKYIQTALLKMNK